MNQELEIRAAKVLGIVRKQEYWVIPDNLKGKISHPTNNVVFDLKFTTSYDWAYLGVTKALEFDEDLFREKMLSLVATETHYPEGGMKFNFDFIGMFKATPEQITQAWVEVLEDS